MHQKSEIEYRIFKSEALKSLPVATTVGNHDADNANYTYHFNRTNASELGSNKGSRWRLLFQIWKCIIYHVKYTGYKCSKNINSLLSKTVAANKDCKWRIVTLHQDIYGSRTFLMSQNHKFKMSVNTDFRTK